MAIHSHILYVFDFVLTLVYHMENFRGHRLEVFLAEAERRVTELTGVFVYSTPRTQSQSGSALVQVHGFTKCMANFSVLCNRSMKLN